jgi:hypothetical protein
VGLFRLGSGFGLGYVLGSRAGRQRYEQLLGDGRRLLQHPKVQEASSRLPAVVQQRIPAARGPEHGGSGNTTARSPVQGGLWSLLDQPGTRRKPRPSHVWPSPLQQSSPSPLQRSCRPGFRLRCRRSRRACPATAR